jgi:hypothetical protein
MTCPDAEPFLLDRQLDATTQAHLDTCAECQAIRTDLMESQARLRAHMDGPTPPALRTTFYTMLGDLQASQPTTRSRWAWLWARRPRGVGLATAFAAVFALGALSTYLVQGRVGADIEVNAVLAQLVDASPTTRLTGIYTVSEDAVTGEQVRDALISLIQTDPSVNVRVAALEALVPSVGDADVRTAIVHVLGSDPEPLVQLAALRVLEAHPSAELRQALDELLTKPDLEPIVRAQVRSILA